jgi:thiamine pyrophosphate-dependent acetolactate synthase large subunit-like protein
VTTIMSGGEALVAALAAHGVDTVFGIPGTHNLPVYAALARHGVEHVSMRHEQGAGFAADGYARVTGRPGVCLTTTGPALLNAVTAAAQAYSDSVPVLLVSPGMPLHHPGRGNGLLHEVKDQQGALNAVVAYSHRVTSVAEVPLAVAQAFAQMSTGRPRPLHLEVPLDLLQETAEVEIVAPIPVPRTVAPGASSTALAARLAAATRPTMVVGGGARAAAAQVRSFAEVLGSTVVSTANGKGVLPTDHPLSVGVGLHHPGVSEMVADSDLVVAVGTELSPADLWLGPLDTAQRLVRIDVDATAVATNAVPSVALVGDAGLTLRAMTHALQDSLGDTLTSTGPSVLTGQAPESEAMTLRTKHAHERAAHWRELVSTQARAEGGPWLEILHAVGQALGPRGVLAGDSAMACYYGALANLAGKVPACFLYPTGLGTLGYGLPAAIGAKVARPDLRVMAMHGDGGLMFTVPELAAAAELGLALPVLVVDNGGYGEIRNEMADRDDPVHAVALGRPDFPLLARALGCHGESLAGSSQVAQDLGSALERAFEADRPTLIHVREDSLAARAMGVGS